MIDEEKDVNQESETSADSTQDVNTQESSSAKVEETLETPGAAGQEAPKFDPDMFDHRGVPWKNVVKEKERKLNELVDKLPEMIEQKFQEVKSPTKQQEYTVDQLETFAIEHPEYRGWVEAQKQELLLKKFESRLEEKLRAEKQATESERVKAAAFQYVAENYSEAFKKDKSGRMVGWDDSHPLTSKIAEVYETYGNGVLKNHPDGLRAAADIAYGLVAKTKAPSIQRQVSKVTAETKKLQQRTMPEGDGTSGQASKSSDDASSALQRLRETGDDKDAQKAIGAIWEKYKIR